MFAINARRFSAPSHEPNLPSLFQRHRSFQGHLEATRRLPADVLLALALALISVGMLCYGLLEPVGSLPCLLIGLLVAAGVLFPDQIAFATDARQYPAPSHEFDPHSVF
jgi:hypothetical protein